jgi:prepilin-type N-terminal cleavage/methylation domain-containing protein
MSIARSKGRLAAGRRGFTLLELLIATGVLVMLGSALVVVLRGGVTTWRRGEARRESFEVAQAILAQLSDDLMCATVDPETSLGGKSVECIFLGDTDESDRCRLALVRTIRGESENTITGHAGSAIGGDARIDYRDDMKKALDRRLRATGGLMEVAWCTGRPGGADAEILYRGIRSPVGGRTSFFASEKNFYRAPLPGEPEPKDPPPEGTAYMRVFGTHVIHFELLYATPYTNTWSKDVPPARTDGASDSGPLAYWDSTRAILKPDTGPKVFTTFLDAASRAEPKDDTLPARVKVILVIKEADAAQSSTALRGAFDRGNELRVYDPGRLEAKTGFVYVEGEWIEYDDVTGDRVHVKSRGARNTRAVPHADGSVVDVGRTFEAVIPLPAAREDWGDR